jgi:hypothetical protein
MRFIYSISVGENGSATARLLTFSSVIRFDYYDYISLRIHLKAIVSSI